MFGVYLTAEQFVVPQIGKVILWIILYTVVYFRVGVGKTVNLQRGGLRKAIRKKRLSFGHCPKVENKTTSTLLDSSWTPAPPFGQCSKERRFFF